LGIRLVGEESSSLFSHKKAQETRRNRCVNFASLVLLVPLCG
jgi:hypothetical protein